MTMSEPPSLLKSPAYETGSKESLLLIANPWSGVRLARLIEG